MAKKAKKKAERKRAGRSVSNLRSPALKFRFGELLSKIGGRGLPRPPFSYSGTGIGGGRRRRQRQGLPGTLQARPSNVLQWDTPPASRSRRRRRFAQPDRIGIGHRRPEQPLPGGGGVATLGVLDLGHQPAGAPRRVLAEAVQRRARLAPVRVDQRAGQREPAPRGPAPRRPDRAPRGPGQRALGAARLRIQRRQFRMRRQGVGALDRARGRAFIPRQQGARVEPAPPRSNRAPARAPRRRVAPRPRRRRRRARSTSSAARRRDRRPCPRAASIAASSVAWASSQRPSLVSRSNRVRDPAVRLQPPGAAGERARPNDRCASPPVPTARARREIRFPAGPPWRRKARRRRLVARQLRDCAASNNVSGGSFNKPSARRAWRRASSASPAATATMPRVSAS